LFAQRFDLSGNIVDPFIEPAPIGAEEWQRIEPHLPKKVRGKKRVDNRRVACS
jgi:hypothetical protein